jgi:type IV secretory pathway VirJ component
MILKNVALLVTVLFFAIGVTACQDKTASQEDREEMTEAVDDFTDTVDEITAEDGGRKEMVEAVEDFTDDIEDVTGDLGYDAKEAGEQTKQ